MTALNKIIRAHGFVPTEDAEQKALASYLDALKLRWMHVPNGGQRNKIIAAKLKGHGVKPGGACKPVDTMGEEWNCSG